MNFDQAISKKVEELRALESGLQNFLMQKQSIQIELNEIENAKEELKHSHDEVYKIVSGVMLKSSKEKLNKEIEEKKKLLMEHVRAIEKQEQLLEKQISELKKEITQSVARPEKKDRIAS